MKNEPQILDDSNLKTIKIDSENLTKNLAARVVIYTLIMLIASSFFYATQLPHSDIKEILFVIATSFILIIMCLFVSVILEGVRYYLRQRKTRKTGIRKTVDPFWFQVIEGAFGLWILLFVLVFLAKSSGFFLNYLSK